MSETEPELDLENMRVVLIDGICKSCHSIVRAVHAGDDQRLFWFVTQQSDLGQRLITDHGLEAYDDESIIFFDRGEIYTLSTAALRILAALRGPISWLRVCLWVPRFVRDGIYLGYAKNRHRLFGKLERCEVPDPGLRARFLDT